MSPPIQPYVLSPHQAGIQLSSSGRFIWPPDRQRRRKVVIHGGGGWRTMRPAGLFESDEHAIFSINNFWNTSRDRADRLRADVWFEVHQIRPDLDGADRGTPIQDEHDMAWLRECPVPLFTTEPFPENPRAVRWPLEDYRRAFRRGGYIACTFAVEIMTAIREGFEEIQVHGLSLLSGTLRETTVESACVAYWLGLAEGCGIKVEIHEGEWLLNHPHVYGFDYWRERRWVEGYVASLAGRPVAI